MKITIEINCEPDLQDLKMHLSVIRQQVIKALKNDNLEPTGDAPIEFSDSNCYGSHCVVIDIE